MADPHALSKLAGIEQKLADLTDVGKQLKDCEDPEQILALQERFKQLARAFDEHVRSIQSALTEAGLVKPQRFRIDLDAAEVEQVRARTGATLSAVELPEPPARALTREEVIELAVQQAQRKP